MLIAPGLCPYSTKEEEVLLPGQSLVLVLHILLRYLSVFVRLAAQSG